MTDVERRARKLCGHPAPRNDSVDIACDRCRFIESIIRRERRRAVRLLNEYGNSLARQSRDEIAATILTGRRKK